MGYIKQYQSSNNILGSNSSKNSNGLNEMIFNDIIPYLVYKRQFKVLLELALISKQSFRIIQNLITYQQKELKISLGSIDSIKQYIEKSYAYGYCYINNYSIKLLQFRDIQYIVCRGSKPSVNKIKNRQELKDYLVERCPQLKRVHLVTFTFADKFEGRDLDHFLFRQLIESFYDYTFDGFFSYDSVETDISSEYLPLSSRKEFIDTFGKSKLENSLYNYSFNYLNHYQPRKLSIKYSRFQGMLLYNLESFLNFSSIESLYIQQPVTSSFISKALKSTTLKSLALTFMFQNDYDLFIGKIRPEDDLDVGSNGSGALDSKPLIYEESGDEDETYNNKKRKGDKIKEKTSKREMMVKELSDSLEALSTNKTLKKLEIRILLPGIYCRDPTLLFETIKSSGNQTLSKLALPGYHITKKKFLEPLLRVPSISTLYFESNPNFKYNLKSFDCYLQHINENHNITKFKCSLLYNSAAYDLILGRLVQFFNENTNSNLTIFMTFQIIIESVFEINTNTDELCKTVQKDCLNIQNQLLEKLHQSNNSLKLVFKI